MVVLRIRTTRAARLGLVAVFLLGAGGAPSDSTSVQIVEPPLKPPATWAYEPAVVTVRVGTTVTWTNTGAVVHTVTADDGKSFDSGVMRPKAVFKLMPTSPGKFTYHCTYHRWMKGTLIVMP